MRAWQAIVAGAVFLGAVALGYLAPTVAPRLVERWSGTPTDAPQARVEPSPSQDAAPGAVPPSTAPPTPPTGPTKPPPEARAPEASKPTPMVPPGAAPAIPPAAPPVQPPFAAPQPGPWSLPPGSGPVQPPFGQQPPGSSPPLPPFGWAPPAPGPGAPYLPPGGPWLPPGALPPMLMLPPGGGGGPSLPGPWSPPRAPGSGPGVPQPPASGGDLAPQPGRPAPAPNAPPEGGSPSGPLFGTPPGAASSSLRTDVAYGPEALQRLDLYLPQGTGPAPMLLFVHGGGWASGDKAELRWLAEKLAREGVLVALANYRLSPAVQHPAHAQDVARAAAWLYRHGAEHGGDPARLYLAGHSAGAHLAALVSLDATYLAAEGLDRGVVRGVAGIAGAAYDLDARYASTPIAQLLAGAFGKDPARWAEAAPVRYVDKDAPSVLLIHGLQDTQAPATSAQVFAQALKRDGVSVKLELLPGHEHGTALIAALPSLRAFVQ